MSLQLLNEVSTERQRIVQTARKFSEPLTSLNQYITVPWLIEAYKRTRKNGAAGIDDQTGADYASNLEENLEDLCNRARSGSYFAPPVKRAWIPKGSGSEELRGIGIPTFEDKVLQRAVTMILEPIYEQEFSESSYGFRPTRSPHQAIEKIRSTIIRMGGGFVLEVDIRKFFDELDHRHLREIMRLRINDGVINRLIGKWLNAGVLDKANITYPKGGAPQGGVFSPLASNIFLNYVLDKWFEETVKPRLLGKAELVRFADDFVLLFKVKEDALRVEDVLGKRLGRFGLRIHPDKTRLIEFPRPSYGKIQGDKRVSETSFSFLGFTFYWDLSRNRKWIVKVKTAKDRLNRSIKEIAEWCRKYRHLPINDQCKELNLKLRGHYQYFGVTHNMRSLRIFFRQTTRNWRKWLNRRDQRGKMPWDKFNNLLRYHKLLEPYLPRSIYRV
jgi:group II intron reverse transcriptase/maturase